MLIQFYYGTLNFVVKMFFAAVGMSHSGVPIILYGGNDVNGKITLSDICDALYREQQKTGKVLSKQTKQQRTNFLSKNIKYVNEIFKAMQITDYLKYIKPRFDLEENGYEFSEKSCVFLVDLLNQYTNENVLELRRGHLDKVSDRCIVWIVEGLYKVFMHNGVPKDILNEICSKMSNLTDYPVRSRYGKMFQMTYDLEQLAGRSYWPKWKTNLGGNDNCIWLDAMQEDLKSFISKWGYIYDSMGEGRRMEVNDIAEQNYRHMTSEHVLRAEIEFALAEKLNEALENDEKLKALEDELNKEIVYKKTGYYADKLDALEYMKKRISKRRGEVEQEVFDKYCKGNDVPPDEDIVCDSAFYNMKSSRKTLEEAIEDYQEWIIPIPKVDLPDIDIDEVISIYKMEQALKKKKEQKFD